MEAEHTGLGGGGGGGGGGGEESMLPIRAEQSYQAGNGG